MRSVTTAALLCAALLLPGCGPGDATVTGTVTVDDRPAPLGEVTFYPVDGGTDRPTPRGVIGADGAYTLKVGAKDRLPTGEYKVAVQVTDLPETPKGNEAPAVKMLSPPKYNNPDTSGFTFTVKPGPNAINLELKSK